jgi:hypothetical protein
MPVKNYKDILYKLDKCDFVEFHGYANIRTTAPVEIRIQKGTQNWKSYVEFMMIYGDNVDYDMNKGYGYWNPRDFPEACSNFDTNGLKIKECFFSINDELIQHIPEESLEKNQVTQEILDSIEEKLASISEKTN